MPNQALSEKKRIFLLNLYERSPSKIYENHSLVQNRRCKKKISANLVHDPRYYKEKTSSLFTFLEALRIMQSSYSKKV